MWGFPSGSRTGRSATLSSSFRVGILSLALTSPVKSSVDALGLVVFSTAIVECVQSIACHTRQRIVVDSGGGKGRRAVGWKRWLKMKDDDDGRGGLRQMEIGW